MSGKFPDFPTAPVADPDHDAPGLPSANSVGGNRSGNRLTSKISGTKKKR